MKEFVDFMVMNWWWWWILVIQLYSFYWLTVMQELDVFIFFQKSIRKISLEAGYFWLQHTYRENICFCRSLGVQGSRSGENTRLPPTWPGFDSQIWRHMWVEFVGSLLCTERFFPGNPVSPLLKNHHLTWFVLIVNLSLQCPQIVLHL